MQQHSNKPDSLPAWLRLLERRHPVDIDLGLERCGEVYQKLGSPRPGKRVITVAGTNGKGSSVTWLCALLQGLGKTCGAFTSPHLMTFNERLQVNGRAIDDASLVAAFERVEQARGDVSLTYFEFTTLAFLLILSQHEIDVAVLEVGLGGRLDTVNLVDADIALITCIGLDHQAYLGDTREAIGVEKAGVMRERGVTVISDPDPPNSVRERARALGCTTRVINEDFFGQLSTTGFLFQYGSWRLEAGTLPLSGDFQAANLAGALMTVLLLVDYGTFDPMMLQEQLLIGIEQTRMTGRLQRAGNAGQFVLDVGHNPLAARAVSAALVQSDEQPLLCVLGMFADKDAHAAVLNLQPAVEQFICAGLAGERGRSGENLAMTVRKAIPGHRVESAESVGAALQHAVATARPGQRILVFGSFVTVAEASSWISDHHV